MTGSATTFVRFLTQYILVRPGSPSRVPSIRPSAAFIHHGNEKKLFPFSHDPQQMIGKTDYDGGGRKIRVICRAANLYNRGIAFYIA